jgi:transposase
MHQEITTVGVDLAKNVFQVHGVSADGRVVVRRQFRRAEVLKFFSALPPCLVGMEACASAHHWARELIAIGHEVKLMPPAYVKAYVKRGKTDAADAEAITEAVTRPTMRFVRGKERRDPGRAHAPQDARPACPAAHDAHQRHSGSPGRVRHLASVGRAGAAAVIAALHERQGELPALARSALHGLAAKYRAVSGEIERLEGQILSWHRASEASRRLAIFPGVGPITASAIAATVPDASLFPSSRQFAAWLGLTPKAHSSGGKERLGGISKQGDGYIRRLLVNGASAVMRMTRKEATRQPWLARLLERKPAKVAAVALANKSARIAWAVMARNEVYAGAAA